MQLEPRHALHPRGSRIRFLPEPHQYLLDDGQPLVSVTSLIHRWFPKFDAEQVARKKAEREGLSYEALLQEWDRKREEAAAFGTKAHLMAEMILRSGDMEAATHLVESEREKAYLEAIREAVRRITLGYEVVESEKIVFSPELRVAGTVDLLLKSKQTGEYVVADWKTNRELKLKGFGGEMGLGPCAHLSHCNFVHYSLQISAYGELLSGEGFIPENAKVRGVLLHLATKPGGRVVCEYVKTRDLSREAGEILRLGV